MIHQSIRQMNKMLGQLDTWLVKTTEYAQKKPFDANTLLPFRLAADFAGAEKRVVALPRWEGKGLTGEDYLLEYAMPNFYFHVTHAYAILRHNGLDIGKKDYVGQLSLRAP
jgi:uncharacterized protein